MSGVDFQATTGPVLPVTLTPDERRRIVVRLGIWLAAVGFLS
jgi:hypothetical protein